MDQKLTRWNIFNFKRSEQSEATCSIPVTIPVDFVIKKWLYKSDVNFMNLVTISELYSVWFQKEFNDEGK